VRTAAAIAAALLALAACRGAPPEDAPIAVTAGKNGFEPWKITARQGKPLTLVVTRTTDETCATEIVIPEAGIEQPLPLLRPVTITFTPARSGELRYSCAMKMFQGVIEVR
jgi:plastocyanin domain-containing protein